MSAFQPAWQAAANRTAAKTKLCTGGTIAAGEAEKQAKLEMLFAE
jgi:hypothetical protein